MWKVAAWEFGVVIQLRVAVVIRVSRRDGEPPAAFDLIHARVGRDVRS